MDIRIVNGQLQVTSYELRENDKQFNIPNVRDNTTHYTLHTTQQLVTSYQARQDKTKQDLLKREMGNMEDKLFVVKE